MGDPSIGILEEAPQLHVPAILPHAPRIMLIGQAPGLEECIKGKPFIGPAGRELNHWLLASGICTKRFIKWAEPRAGKDGHWETDRSALAISNVFDEALPWSVDLGVLGLEAPGHWGDKPTPENGAPNGMMAITTKTADAKQEGWLTPPCPPPISAGRYLIPAWGHHLDRLRQEIADTKPDLLIALGDQALWALSGTFGIDSRRGGFFKTSGPGAPPGLNAIATYHPAHILRGNQRLRPTAISDLVKAKESLESKGHVPRRELWLSPTLHDIRHFTAWHCKHGAMLAIDIETIPAQREITSIAFAPSRHIALCIPFIVDKRSYWSSLDEEVEAWAWVRTLCESPAPKVLQNGLYDIQWLWDIRRIKVLNYVHDTRLAHHALFPELPKSLGWMGAMWENEAPWKKYGIVKSGKGDD